MSKIQEVYEKVMCEGDPATVVGGSQTWKKENFIQIAKGTIKDLPTPLYQDELNIGQIEEHEDTQWIWDYTAKQWVEFVPPPEDSEGEVIQ